jgi:tRNA1(Val) A37 N6-methylase TrmN6
VTVPGGIVRPARRPAGWRAPGPPPRAATAPDPGPHEDVCYLAGDWRIFQRIDGHRWSLDDLVTAWYAAESGPAPARLVDLGCGIGTVLMLLAWRFPALRGVGIEAQELSVTLARRSIAWNGAEDRCAVRLGDLRDPAVVPEPAAFDLVTGTPPYLPPGTATESARVQVAPCHVEQRGGVEAYCAAAARLLTPDGRFVTCAAASQTARVIRAAAESGLSLVRRRDVVPRAGKPPLFTVQVLQRSSGPCAIEPPLVVRDAEGERTPEFHALRHAMGMPP